MKKIKLHGIGNQDNFNYYAFDKKNEVLEILGKLFAKIFDLHINFFDGDEDKKGNWKERKRNFEKLKDVHDSITDFEENERIDIFYGDKKIFVGINCSQKLRLKFNEELERISMMPEPKKEKK